MKSHGHRRRFPLFLLAIILPSAVMVILGLRMIGPNRSRVDHSGAPLGADKSLALLGRLPFRAPPANPNDLRNKPPQPNNRPGMTPKRNVAPPPRGPVPLRAPTPRSPVKTGK